MLRQVKEVIMRKERFAILLTVMLTFTGLSAHCQQTTNVLEKWGFAASFSSNGEVHFSKEGIVTIPVGDIQIDFYFTKPSVIRPSKAKNQFDFDSVLPKGGSGVKIVFTASDIKYADARIPMFTPLLAFTSMEKLDNIGTEFSGAKFADYGGKYAFKIKLSRYENGGISIIDLNCFRDGAEHYIYGDVKLFGAKFSNKSKEPLIFKISGGKYAYISGNGIVTTKDGASITVGKPSL